MEDILVAGFDDVPAAGWKGYDLTSFVQDAESMVAATLDIIGDRGGGEIKDMSCVIEARLVERSTTDASRFHQNASLGE